MASGGGPDPGQAGAGDRPGEGGVLGEEAVAGVHRLRHRSPSPPPAPGRRPGTTPRPAPGPSSTASSASRTCSAPASASEYTATALIPSRWQVRITRTAISPRLATSTVSNTRPAPLHPERSTCDVAEPVTPRTSVRHAQIGPGAGRPGQSIRYSTTVVSTTTSRSLAEHPGPQRPAGPGRPRSDRATRARTSCSMPYLRRHGRAVVEVVADQVAPLTGHLAVEVQEDLGQHLAAVGLVRLPAAHDASSSAALARTRPRSLA